MQIREVVFTVFRPVIERGCSDFNSLFFGRDTIDVNLLMRGSSGGRNGFDAGSVKQFTV
jgi:hypothetical protein